MRNIRSAVTFAFWSAWVMSGFSSMPARAIEASPCQTNMPSQVFLKSNTQSYNQKYFFILRNQIVCIKDKNDPAATWSELEVPQEIRNSIAGLSSDDEYLVVRINDQPNWRMLNALSSPKKFKWEIQRGFPFGKGTPVTVPATAIGWGMSFISPKTDKHYLDEFGKHTVGVGCTSFMIVQEDGQVIDNYDPWLEADRSYRICGPKHGRLRIAGFGVNGSVVGVMDANGNVYTARRDFDIEGGDRLFISYKYGDTCKSPNCYLPLLSPRRLPLPEWEKLPAFPNSPVGFFTNTLSIDRLGTGARYKEFRVEAVVEDQTGYYRLVHDFLPFLPHEAAIAGQVKPNWEFVATNHSLDGVLLGDTSEVRPDIEGPRQGKDFAGAAEFKVGRSKVQATIHIEDFNGYCSPSKLTVTVANEPNALELKLHTHQSIRLKAIDAAQDPMKFYAAIEIPETLHNNLKGLSAAQAQFLKTFLNSRRFTRVNVTSAPNQVNLEHISGTIGVKSIHWNLQPIEAL